ncbi:MAG: hypothetical protein HZB39_00140 [Planctomycetes bacterium]|nr:hypothetical protein [Planctomycetota bacterium]
MRTLLAALVLLIAAAGAWWVLGDGDETVAPTPTSSGDAIASPAPGPRESAPLPDAPSTRDAIESPPASVPYVFRIKVVRDDDGAPVEGAELRTGPSAATAGEWPPERRRMKGESQEDHIFRAGLAWRSDEHGQASIGHDERMLAVFVRSGELHAHGVFRTEDGKQSGDFELRLIRDATLVFLTLDDADAPVAGVRLQATSSGLPWSRSFGPSDDSGRITVRHAQELRPQRSGSASLEIAADVVGSTEEAVPVSLDPVPVEPVVIRVPPCASLEIVALDAEGARWIFAAGEPATVYATTKGSSRADMAVFDSGGIARLRKVRCGATLVLSSEDLANAELTVTAPDRAGETRRVELRVPAGAAVLAGRLVALGGTVLRGEYRLALQIRKAGSTNNITAGADGRFREAAPLLLAGSTPSIQVFGKSQENPPRHLVARVALTRPLDAGINDLGDIVLAPAPELVSGRIEWGDGSAAKGIHVSIERETEPGRWRRDSTDLVRTSDDGSFVAWGLHDSRRCRIEVSRSGDPLRTELIAFVPGARDVVVRLERGASLEASFLVDGDTPWRTFKFSLAGSIPEPSGLMYRRKEPGDDGRMRVTWPTIPPGTYRLAVSIPGESSPFITVEDVAVTGSRVTDDPRLIDIDLRGRVQRCELLIVDPDERPIADRPARLRRPPGDEGGVLPCQQLDPGRYELALSAPIDLEIEAGGFLMREYRAVVGRATVRMERAPEFRLRCRATLPLGTALRVRVRLLDPLTGRVDRRGRDDQSLVIGSPEPVTWSPGTDGNYAIELAVARFAASEPVTAFEPARLDFRTLVPGQIIEIVPDPAALAAALAKLKD